MKNLAVISLLFLSFFNVVAQTISGELKKWHKITLSVNLPTTDLTESDATYRNHRMDVIFTSPTGAKIRVPGHFDADGDPANTSAKSGKNFKAYLRPNEIGAWTYEVLYFTGIDIALKAVNELPAVTQTLTGNVGTIAASDKSVPDLRAKGRLIVQSTGDNKQKRYFQFAETGEYYLKLGPDSPENFFNFNEFDHDPGTRVNPGFTPVHKFAPHARNFFDGNPTWGTTQKGKNIIGAVNYLKAQKMNSMSLSLYGGDDINVFPWTTRGATFTYDTSKLAQWEIVLNHAEQSGLMLHLKLAENENWDKLSSNEIKVFYREMIARFGHHLAIEWNISEEYGGQGATVATAATAIERIDFLAENDPWQNPRVIHTYPGRHFLYDEWLKLDAKIDGASIQSSQQNNYKDAYDGNSGILTWVNKSKNNGTPWVVASDEQNPGSTSIYTSQDINTTTVLKEARTRILWKTHIAGGQGVMWYGGGQGDFKTEDFERFDTLFAWSRYAVLHFFKNNQIEYWKMENDDSLVSGTDNNCLAETGKAYVIYLTNGGTTNLNLSGVTGNFSVKWFDPRNGGGLKDGSVTSVTAGGNVSIGNPPSNTSEDWVALIRLAGSEPTVSDPETIDTSCTFKLNATTDFPNTDLGGEFVPAEVDAARNALSVNSIVYPDKFAGASTTFTGLDGAYNFKINTIAEEDGESTYKIKVNNIEVASFTNPETTLAFSPTESDIFENIVLRTGDLIQVEFNSVSNGKIPENGAFAFARGRWTSLEIFCPGETPNVVVDAPLPNIPVYTGDDLIIDNRTINDTDHDTGYIEAGVWNQSGLPGFANGTRWSNDPEANIRWVPNFGEEKEYEVFIYKIVHPNSDNTAPVIVTHKDGTETFSLDFTNGQSGWVKLGKYTFAAGTDGFVRLKITSGKNGRADAVRFAKPGTVTEPVPEPEPEPTPVDICDGEYLETNGLVVIEAEAFDISGTSWKVKNTKPGFTGEGYLEWLGADLFNTPGTGVISAKFKITTTGKYRFVWRTTVGEGTNTTEANDSWIKFPDADDFYGEKPGGERTYPIGEPKGRTPNPEGAGGSGWLKSYVNNLNWSFQSVTGDNADGRNVFVEFNSPGIYTVQLSGRSKHHLIDRIALARNGVNAANTNLTQSNCSTQTATPIASDNFEIQVTGESCPTSNDGSIKITAKDSTLSYFAKVIGNSTSESMAFNDEILFSGLAPREYDIEITATEASGFIQRFTVPVKSSEIITASAKVSQSAKQLTLSLSGASNYTIKVNGNIYNTNENEFTANLKDGENSILVSTEKDCQGKFSEKIVIGNTDFWIKNPFTNLIEISLPIPEKEVQILVRNATGKILISSLQFADKGKIILNSENLSSGLYFVTLKGKSIDETVKIIKK